MELMISKIIFTSKAIKKIRKEKDKIRIKKTLEELGILIKTGIKKNHQERKFMKYEEIDLFDYLEHHKKQRIIINPINEKEINIVDILYDHLGRDKLDYERYWEGKENLEIDNYLELNIDLLKEIFIYKKYDLFFSLLNKNL